MLLHPPSKQEEAGFILHSRYPEHYKYVAILGERPATLAPWLSCMKLGAGYHWPQNLLSMVRNFFGGIIYEFVSQDDVSGHFGAFWQPLP